MSNSTAAQPLNAEDAELLTKQVASWRKEIARLQDLIAHATGSTGAAQPLDLDNLKKYVLDGNGVIVAVENAHFKCSCEFVYLSDVESLIAQARAAQPKTCPHCGLGDIEISRECHNSSCSAYAHPEAIYRGWRHVQQPAGAADTTDTPVAEPTASAKPYSCSPNCFWGDCPPCVEVGTAKPVQTGEAVDERALFEAYAEDNGIPIPTDYSDCNSPGAGWFACFQAGRATLAPVAAQQAAADDASSLREALCAVDSQLVAILNSADGATYNKLKAARNDLVRIWLPLGKAPAAQSVDAQDDRAPGPSIDTQASFVRWVMQLILSGQSDAAKLAEIKEGTRSYERRWRLFDKPAQRRAALAASPASTPEASQPLCTKHHSAVCERVKFSEHYSSKNHSAQFKCPICGTTRRQNLNFLGRGVLVCDGSKTKVEKKS